MTVHTETSDTSDQDLIAAVRKGALDAYADLYHRHAPAAQRLARTLARDPADVDDLVAEAFARVLATLRDGRGPDLAFRAYLLTTLRHVRYDRARRDRRLQLTDDLTPYEPGVPFEDTPLAELERSYAARAFAKLPERWRMVLWHTEVEGETPAQVAPLLGLTPNGVAALAYRARERLRQMYLQEHISDTANVACHRTAERLGAAVRGALAAHDQSKVDAHLARCATCRLLHAELAEVNSGLREVLAPLVLGGSAAAYLAGPASHTGAAVAGWLSTLWQAPARLWRQLSSRYGRSSVAAGAGLVAAVLIGSTALAVTLATQSAPAPHHPHAAAPAGPVRPAPVVPPPALPELPTEPAPVAPATTTTAPALRPRPTQPDRLAVTPVVRTATLVAGSAGQLPITIRTPEAVLTSAFAPVGHRRDVPVVLTLGLPEGVRLRAADAGDGWQCTPLSTGARCTHDPLPVGRSSTARVPVRVAGWVTGFRPLTLTLVSGSRRVQARVRIAVAPAQMTVAYATSARVRTALAGNTLLSCLPRPGCLGTPDNQQVSMVAYRPGPGDPVPPAGLARSTAASAALLAVPPGARVRWAGLFWVAASAAPPGTVSVHGPGGRWLPVSADRVSRPAFTDRPVAQAYTDVTDLVRNGGGGLWWVAAPVADLPSGLGRYAGWALAVVYDDAGAPLADLAVYAGPAALRDGGSVSVAVSGRPGTPVDVGLAVWDGDRALPGDALQLGRGRVVDNVGRSLATGAAECLGRPAPCPWNTLGVDITTLRSSLKGSADAVTVRSGLDPVELGVLTVLVPAAPG